MAHFDQSPAAPEPHDPQQASRNAKRGLVLFAIYSSIYGLFVALNAFVPQSMETIVWSGLNLAVTYGLGLIGLAFLLALLYAWMCR